MTAGVVKVCVIGGGPAAMFFCHAYNRQRREAQAKAQQQQQQQGRDRPVWKELQITCWERHATPGGLWRDTTTTLPTVTSIKEDDTSDVYDELWTNGASHTLEFHDYTFDEHFEGQAVPVYLPRRDVSEYLIGRVTKDAPTFFDDYFQFNTEVVRVQEVSAKDKDQEEEEDTDSDTPTPATFLVTVRNLVTGQLSTHHFDKCIWAAGENGLGSIPTALRSLFLVDDDHVVAAGAYSKKNGGDEKKMADEELVDEEQEETVGSNAAATGTHYKVPLLHSSQTNQIRKSIQHIAHGGGGAATAASANVLLIGGGLSAEDMALQCLKWGANHVHVVARDESGEISWTKHWPGKRVTVYLPMAIQSVEQTCTDEGKGATIHLQEVEPVWPYGYEFDPEGNPETLHDIHLVVCCTGYRPNTSMLDESLVPVGGRSLSPYFGSLSDQHPSNRLDADPNFDWSTWTMTDDHVYFDKLGHVPIAQGQPVVRAHHNPPDMHRGIWLSNPNMMYLLEHGHDIPLLSLDIHAWLFSSYLTGYVPMPTVEELIQANREQVLDQLHLPDVRYLMDKAYFDAMWEKLYDDDIDDEDATEKYMLRLLARIQQEGRYPDKSSLGTYEELNATGKRLMAMMCSSYYQRTEVKRNIPDDEDVKEAMEWRTFRDDVGEVEDIYSLHTGNVARPLKMRWMDLVGGQHSVKTGI